MQDSITDETQKAKIIARLKRLEGQIRGICNMVESGRKSIEILRQLTSISGAINGVWINIASEQIKSGLGGLPLLNYDETAEAIVEYLRMLK